MQIHISKDDKQLGVFSEEQIESMIASKMLSPSDLYWKEGMEDWLSLRTGFSSFASTPPPLRNSRQEDFQQTPTVLSGHIQRVRKLAIIFLSIFACWKAVSFMLTLVLVFGDLYYSTQDSIEVVQKILSVIFDLTGVTGIVFASMLHYKCWKALPSQSARTTPGKAVGFLFIPFYSYYWGFVSIVGLAKDYQKWAQNQHVQMKESSIGIGTTIAILNIASSLIFFLSLFIYEISLLQPIIYIAGLVLWFFFYSELSKIAQFSERN